MVINYVWMDKWMDKWMNKWMGKFKNNGLTQTLQPIYVMCDR